ncbi:hypothetical protein ACHAQA_001200 [Verticillium albo-atrum]
MAKKRTGSRFPDAPRPKKQKLAPPPPKNPKGKASAGGQGQGKAKTKPTKQQHQNQKPVLPFGPRDAILLIGEGDLSFAASLAAHHGCTNLTATVLEKNEAELLEKYPHAGENIAKVLAPNATPADDDGSDPEDDFSDDDDPSSSPKPPKQSPTTNRILYNTDATTLRPFTAKVDNGPRTLRAGKVGLFTHIAFNFPHVGGKSTDQNRQVRHNQSLIVAFFERALPSLAPGGTVTVTLFEGEPYTLWNVKDLARHAGLAVETSFRFPWTSYPGYRHARTLGVVKARGAQKGGEDEGEKEEQEQEAGKEGERKGESKTAWRGEDRAARSYVFKRKDEVDADAEGKKNHQKKKPEAEAGGKKKRHKIDVSDSDSDSD